MKFGAPVRHRQRHRRLFLILTAMLCIVIALVIVRFPPWSDDLDLIPRGPSGEDIASEAQDSGAFSIPGEFESDPLRMDAEDGESRWLDLSMDAYLEPGAASAAYVAIHLGCTDSAGAEALNVSGTQNIRQDESTSINMAGLFEPENSGAAMCRIKVNAPNAEVAASGSTIDIDTHLVMGRELIQGDEASPRSSLPAVVDPGESTVFFEDTLPAEEDGRVFRASTTMHLTTCTIKNGSKDSNEGDTLCEQSKLDEEGSNITVRLTQNVEKTNASGCGAPQDEEKGHHIDRDQHHYILTLPGEYNIPAECDGTPKFKVTLQNEGPAPVVVHSNSTRAYGSIG